ncbi:hypothetical protein [Leuconostoc mesenteroides]|uniref:hypothetical protein n=1 Tax=Leuconostoc mesenteroides TaxID=1245 RepID=UPI0030D25BF4
MEKEINELKKEITDLKQEVISLKINIEVLRGASVTNGNYADSKITTFKKEITSLQEQINIVNQYLKTQSTKV